MFKPEIEEELKQFLVNHGYGGDNPLITCEGSIPKWGTVVLEDGIAKLQPIERPTFGQARSLALTVKHEGVNPKRKHALPRSGLV